MNFFALFVIGLCAMFAWAMWGDGDNNEGGYGL